MSIESALKDVAAALGIDVPSLTKLISFESNFDSLAKNPYSGARGLIQFMNSTARDMGYDSADDLVNKFPDAESQLRGPVYQYLSKFTPFVEPFPQSLYLSVFYPAYRYKPADTAFSEIVRKQNPGINFVGDYVAKVEKKKLKIISLNKYSVLGFIVPVAAFALAAFYLTFTKETENEQKRLGRCSRS